MQSGCWHSSRGVSGSHNILLEPVPAPVSGWRSQCQKSSASPSLWLELPILFAGAAQCLLELSQNGSPLGSGSAAKSSGWKRSSIWQILCRDRPGTTSDRMARSVSTSFGIISRSAVARSLGKYVYLKAQQPGPQSCIDASQQGATTVQAPRRLQPCRSMCCVSDCTADLQGDQQGIISNLGLAALPTISKGLAGLLTSLRPDPGHEEPSKHTCKQTWLTFTMYLSLPCDKALGVRQAEPDLSLVYR